jgi:hypothetical protein
VKNMSSYGQHDLLYGFHIYFHDHLCCENKHDHSPISYVDVVKKVNVEEPTHGFPAASSTSFNNIKKLNSAVHTTSNSMKENHKSVAILAPKSVLKYGVD